MLAHSYKRFSFSAQKKGDSIRRQTMAAESYCTTNKLTLSDQTFEDLGVSAFRSNNSKDDAGLGKFLLAVNEGKVDTPCYLLVESLDRLSRDNIDNAIQQLIHLAQADVIVVTLQDNHVYKKGMSMIDYITALLIMQRANEESEIKSKRLQAAWQNRRTNPDAKKTKNCPFWLTVSEDRKSFDLNNNVDLVQRVFAHALDGIGSPTIAKMLNSEGLVSPKGKAWSDATVASILRNQAVIGVYEGRKRYNEDGKRVDALTGDRLENYYPALFSADYFYSVQAAMQSRSKTQKHATSGSHLNVIKSIAACGCCGGSVRLKQQQHLHYLICSSREKGLCTSKPISLRFLQDWLKEVWLTAAYSPVSANAVPEMRQLAPLETKLQIIKEQIARLAPLLENDFSGVIATQLNNKNLEGAELQSQITALKETLAPYNLSKAAIKERSALVAIAFKEGNTTETITARSRLALLLTQLKRFTLHMDTTGMVTFEVITAKNESKIYHAAIRPYHHKSKHTGKVWLPV
ncbi:recombinase family protein [Vibrio sp. FF145]|uniref:recombinase family protein n=1 Tax=Vibrio sp. FF145 TaxID=3230013 RepID=UPI00352CC040